MNVLTLFFLLLPQPVPAERVLEVARATIKASGFCFLITVDQESQAQARLMDPFTPEDDMTVWMGTNRHTRKVQQIHRNARVTLACSDQKGQGYVTLLGRARVVEDLEERKKRWRKEWAGFYPGGPEGETYVLIEFIPAQIEVMSIQHKIASEPLAWKPAILVKKGVNWDLMP